MFRSVSFRALSNGRGPGQKQTSAGLELIAVKKLNGATFARPSTLIVDTNAIGRGTIEPIKSL